LLGALLRGGDRRILLPIPGHQFRPLEKLSQQAIAYCPEISPELAQEVDEALSEAGLHGFSVVLSLELAVFCNVNREKDYRW
jgi:hypothetical protein